ncbi:signal recognition particle-docking protein FtsY [Tardibacter chloracetimidivorans]|uniref:Signal recognition particle receptor FtsY n=1 Tax=Tardibacter chloracetimidivorans TaxID=1921510 RepID=A0A1L3ZZH0_9SPHN|nr:signal recognition particle-docking protein FtsY [Tardibacter chloracetimidivorans]API61028.1 signal recognition particle-docking protein FtsY [Tardibacter chloracetimidivorans]
MEEKGGSWLDRLRRGFSRTSERLNENLTGLVGPGIELDERTLGELEEALIATDLGPAAAARIAARVGEGRYSKTLDEAGLRAIVADEIAKILRPVAKPLEITAFPRPHVVLVVGVNGSGKTTTIAKLAHLFTEQDYSVMLAAGDTFRAAAIAQLQTWGDRAGVPVVSGKEGADAAGLVFDAHQRARAEGVDVLIVDTAGRLQNKQGLMDELAKVKRVLGKLDAAAPHDVVLVLDATVGQNAFSQIEAFRETAGVTGLVMTKLDGTARGGVLVAAAERYGLPIHAVGVGETMTDLRPFDADELARAIAGAR